MEPNSPLDTASSSNPSLSHSSSSDNQVFVRLSVHQKQHWTTTPWAQLSDTSHSSISTNDTEPKLNAAHDDKDVSGISTHNTESQSRDDEDKIPNMSSDLVDSVAEKKRKFHVEEKASVNSTLTFGFDLYIIRPGVSYWIQRLYSQRSAYMPGQEGWACTLWWLTGQWSCHCSGALVL